MAEHPEYDDCREKCPRLELKRDSKRTARHSPQRSINFAVNPPLLLERVMSKKHLNVGLVGYGFMGRTHSNAFLQGNRYFDLPYQAVLKAVCARNPERVQSFAANWGYESIETDWRKLIDRKDIDLIDIASPNDTTC